MVRITFVGAFFLVHRCYFADYGQFTVTAESDLATFYGGTSLLIAVSVAFDLVQKIDSYLVMCEITKVCCSSQSFPRKRT